MIEDDGLAGAVPAPAAAAPLAAPVRSPIKWVAAALGLTHLAVMSAVGLRPEHAILDTVLVILPWLGPRAAALTGVLLPLWLTGVVVDGQRFLPLLGRVHTADIWFLDARLFPAPGGTNWPDYLHTRFTPVVDLFAGFSYAAFIYEYIGVVIFWYFTGDRRRSYAMGWAFFIVNTAGALVYVFFPVAPPWYIVAHGLGPAVIGAAGSAAGCARFDALLGVHYFAEFYGRNPNVFGAMPSLHVCYPLLVTLYTWKLGSTWRVPTILFTALVAFSALYLTHHYVIDVIAGFLLAVCAWGLAEWWVTRRIQPGRQTSTHD